jgi:hypothetical protein
MILILLLLFSQLSASLPVLERIVVTQTILVTIPMSQTYPTTTAMGEATASSIPIFTNTFGEANPFMTTAEHSTVVEQNTASPIPEWKSMGTTTSSSTAIFATSIEQSASITEDIPASTTLTLVSADDAVPLTTTSLELLVTLSNSPTTLTPPPEQSTTTSQIEGYPATTAEPTLLPPPSDAPLTDPSSSSTTYPEDDPNRPFFPWILPGTYSLIFYDLLITLVFGWVWWKGGFRWWCRPEGEEEGHQRGREMLEWSWDEMRVVERRERSVEREMRRMGML